MILEIIDIFEHPVIENQFPLGDVGDFFDDDDYSTDEEETEDSEHEEYSEDTEDSEDEEEYIENYEELSALMKNNNNNDEQETSSFPNDWLPPETPERKKFNGLTTYMDQEGVLYLRDTRQDEELYTIRTALASHYKDNEPSETITDWTEGEPCVAYDSEKNLYFRSRIIKLDKEHSTCTVRLIDYGNLMQFAFKSLRKGTPTQHIPSLAQPCLLHNIKPAGGTWTEKAIDYMNTYIVGEDRDVRLVGVIIKERRLLIDLVLDRTWAAKNLPSDLLLYIHCTPNAHRVLVI